MPPEIEKNDGYQKQHASGCATSLHTLCLHRHRRTHDPSPSTKKKPEHLQPRRTQSKEGSGCSPNMWPLNSHPHKALSTAAEEKQTHMRRQTSHKPRIKVRNKRPVTATWQSVCQIPTRNFRQTQGALLPKTERRPDDVETISFAGGALPNRPFQGDAASVTCLPLGVTRGRRRRGR